MEGPVAPGPLFDPVQRGGSSAFVDLRSAAGVCRRRRSERYAGRYGGLWG